VSREGGEGNRDLKGGALRRGGYRGSESKLNNCFCGDRGGSELK